MWLIYILIAAAVLIPIGIGIHTYFDIDELGLSIMATFVSWVIAALLLLLIVSIMLGVANDGVKIESRTEQITMHALSDSSDIHGRFGFLGSGYIDEELTYYYVVQEKDEYGRECFEVESISAKDAGIVYIAEGEKPYLLQSYYVYESKFFDSIFGEQTGKIYFYVPEGSIVENYKVDLE